jgi:DNA-binding CsgD family transcriptional regulator
MTVEIIGREEELASIGTFLADVERGPRVLVLAGEPGIGKTVLWEKGVAEARSSFGRVLTCRGVEAEASLAFAGLSELLAPVFDEAAPSLLAPRRRALEIALLRVEPGEMAPDLHAIGLAVLDVLVAQADGGPVLVAVDDLQWLDPASAAVLQIALRRLRGEPVGLLATVRSTPETAVPLEPERSFREERLEQLTVGPLSLSAVHGLLKERLGLELTRPELVRVQEATAGNPFFALELGRELVRTGARPAHDRALHVPDSLRDLLGGRLARLPGETLDVLLLVAALARPTVELVAAAYGDRERVLEALETGAEEGVVEFEGSGVRFAHPLLASICYERPPPWKRRAVHHALAAAVTDVEERARHLALAAGGRDASIASELDTAAEHAAARGATTAAGELSELAAELTPDDPALERKRLLGAATFHRLAGDTERAAALLNHLLADVPPGVERADVLFGLASVWYPDVPTILELCDRALAEATSDDARSARILALRGIIRLNEPDVQGALADARSALEKAERVDDPVLLATAIAVVLRAEEWAAEITPGLLDRGLEIEEGLGLELGYAQSPRLMLARLLMRLGEVDRARAMLEELTAKAAARGDEFSRAELMWYLSLVEWLAGRWQLAVDHAAAARELDAQRRTGGWWLGRIKALIEADLGLVDEARSSAREGLAVALEDSMDTFAIVTLGVLGRIELALGNLEAADGYLRELPVRLLEGGLNDPSQPVWADAIETLVALGELERARAYLEAYDLHARRLGSPLAREGVLRCRGLLAAADGRLDAAVEVLERALSEQPEPAWPFERARTLLCLGTVRRQSLRKNAAREALEQALAAFEGLGARLWAEKARAELGRISGRAPPSGELTETERRVAELAARGRSNKEIAAELFMGVSTVEAHLSRVYRKLGVRRAGLAARLAPPGDGAAKPVDATPQS